MKLSNGKTQDIEIPLADQAAFHRRLKSRKRIVKSFEAKANSNRTLSEKAADIMTSRLGTMSFLILNFLWFTGWLLFNSNVLKGVAPFDPFPFGLLTTMVSLEAIFLSIIVLISQNRASKIDDIRDETNLQITTLAEEEITKMMELQILVLKKHGIDVSDDIELQQMLQPTDTNRIETEVEKQLGE